MRRAPVLALGVVLQGFLLIASPVPAAPEEAQPQDEGPPKVTSPWKSWQFSGSEEKVRSELFSLIREEGLTLTRQDEKKGTFATGLVEFDDKKFGVGVALPPPKAGPKYPYFQLNDMTSGRYGLEGRFKRLSAGETGLDLRAVLEIRGMDEKVRHMRWVPRISNGEVERFYFTRLSLRLLKPPAAATGK